MAGELITGTMDQDSTSLLFSLPIAIQNSGTLNYLLDTKDKYLNGNVGISVSTPAGSIDSAVSSLPNGVSSSGTISRGNYIKIGSGYYNTDQYFLAQSNTGGTLSITTSHNAGTNIDVNNYTYVNITGITVGSGKTMAVTNNGGTTTVTSNSTSAGTVTIAAKKTSGASSNTSVQVVTNGLLATKTVSFGGHSLTNTNYTKNDLAVTFGNGSDTNMSNITYGAKDTTNYPYYFKITGTTPAISSTTTVAIGAVTYTNDLGIVEAHSGATAIDATSSSPTVTVNGANSNTYIKLKAATATNSATGSANITSLTYTYDTTNEYFTVSGSGTISGTATLNVSQAGYLPKNNITGSTTGTASLSGVTVDQIVGTTSISGTLTYKPSIDKATVPSGTTIVNAVASGSVTTSPTANGVYVAVQSSSGTNQITATPSVTTNGYGTSEHHGLAAGTANVGAAASDITYIPIKTSTAKVDTSQSITANPGISFPASGTLRATYSGSKSITGSVTAAGWISSVSSATVTTSGTTDVTSLALPATYNFTLSTTAGSSGDNTGYTITNNGYRKLTITNNANGTTAVTSNKGTVSVTSGIDSSTPKGTISIAAYPASGTTIESAQTIVENGRWKTPSVSAGGTYYGKVTVASGSVTAPGTISGTSATVSTGTNTVTFTKTISVTPNVTTAGYISSGTAGNSSVSLTASITTKAAATITPGTSPQEIAAGTYLTGKQTIAGDADLVAGNIKTGVNIFNVAGTFTASSTATGTNGVASAAQILPGYSAWVNGTEVVGSMDAVVLGSAVADGKTQSSYTDISEVDGTPILISGSGLYINAGYIGDTYISLARLVPDGTNITGHADYIYTGYSAYDNNGAKITGTMPTCTLPTNTATSSSGTSKYTVPVSTSTRYINIPKGYNAAAGYYTIRPVALSTSLTESTKQSNVKTGVTVTVGDNGSSTRLVNFTGTFTAASTAQSANGAASTTKILLGYGAWVDGSEITGSITTYDGSYTLSP